MNKSPYDTNEYKIVTLDNLIKIIFVHDKNATKSGASLAVSVGSFDETEEGTAHFLEHLLFMGSEKYPNENMYGAFISENGGSTNAYTSDTYTNYMFDINSEKFIEALDMFSQMFVSSLLHESAVEKELKAVNSEFTNYCNHDGWRSQEVMKCIANPNHPYKKFSVGNSTSLNIPNIVDCVRKLYNDKYSSNLMNLCLVSNLDFDVLEPMVRQMFEQIPNKNYVMNKSYPPFFTNMQKTISIIPIKNQHMMTVTWQAQKLYSETDEYNYKPSSFLGHILGHEGKGSILAKLKNLNWASSLSAGVSENCYTYELFSLDMVLTDEGIQNVDNILNIIYDYINICNAKLGSYDECKSLYDDNKNSHNLTWTFAQKKKALSNAISTVSMMHQYNFLNLENLNFAPYYFAEFDSNAHSLILQYLSQLVQQNSLIKLSSKSFEANQFCYSTEQWYKALYTVTDNDVLEFPTTFNGLNLPSKNIFIPTNLLPTVSESEWMDQPQLVTNNDVLKLFCKKTNKFGLPHANATFMLSVDGYYTNIRTNVLTSLLSSVVMSQLNDVLYDAQLLNYTSGVSSAGGLSVVTSGFYDKLPDLLKIIVDVLVVGDIEESFFDLSKEQWAKYFTNEKFTESSRLINSVLNSSVNPQHMLTEDKLNVLNSLEHNDLLEFVRTLTFDNCVALFEGNVNNTFIDEMSQQILRLKFNGVDNYIPNEIIQPTTGSDYAVSKVSENPKELNDCILVSYSYGKSHCSVNPDSFKFVSLANLVDLFISEPFFDELRTKQQLGYTVYSYSSTNLGRCFEKLFTQNYLIQSPNTPCDELLKRIDTFMQDSVEKMKMLDDKLFETYVNALRVELSKPDNSLTTAVASDLEVIRSRHNLFNIKLLTIQALDQITKEDLINFFLEHYVLNVKRYVVKLTSTCLKADGHGESVEGEHNDHDDSDSSESGESVEN